MNSFSELGDNAGQKLYKRAKQLIPGGTQLLSKRPEMFAPNLWPSYYSRAKGCSVWDLEGTKYVDMSIMAVGACILGYADDDVDDQVVDAIKNGVSSSLNCPEEVELAEALIDLHPWFGMVRYSRGGGEALAIAVRIARAKTSRDIILFSGYHGWSDWYLAANIDNENGLDGQLMPGLQPNGVPRQLGGTAIPFDCNDIESLKEKIKGRESEIAAIMIEPARGEEASENYLAQLKELAAEIGAVLIFDEITSGYRMCVGGIHRRYGIYPDMAVFAKSMANGYPISAILGTENVMQAAQSTFISSTNWTDRIGPVAALATLRKYQEKEVDKHIIKVGDTVKGIWRNAAKASGLSLSTSGLSTLPSFSFNDERATAMNTKFVIEMLGSGFLGFRQFKPSFAHTDSELTSYSESVNKIFQKIASCSDEDLTEVEPAHQGFKRLTKE